MLSFLKKIFGRLKKIRPGKPLVGHSHDLKLLRRIKGRRFPRWCQFFHFKHILSKKEKRIFNWSLLLLVVGIIWAGYGFTKANRVQVPAIGGQYVEAVVGSPQLANPVFANVNDVDVDLVRLIYSGLMRYDEKQRLVPDLAVKYPEVSEDKKVYTFELKKDVIWHDGEPFTAQDVVFTIETIQDPEINSPLLVSFNGVAVEAVDDYTVKFTLQEAFSAFVSSLTVGILPEHIWFDKTVDRFKLAPQNLQPIGTGPFMFKKLSKDETGHIYRYELQRFERYYRQPSFLEVVAFQFYPDYEGLGGAIEALRGQKVDGLHFVPSDLKEKVERKHIILHTLQLPQYTALFFNQDKEPFLADEDLRTALAYALDKDRILREALGGEGQVIYSPILPGFPGYNPEIAKTPYSWEEANKLLDEKKWERISYGDYRQELKDKMLKEWEESYVAGVAEETATSTEATSEEASEEETGEETETTDDTTVDTKKEEERQKAEEEINARLDQELNEAQTFYRQDKDGNLLELTLVTADTQEYQQTAQLIAGFWQEIGVKTVLKFVPTKDISREVLKKRDYDILLYGAIVGNDPDQYPFWHSSQIDFPGLNLARYVNRSADELLEEAREATDEEKKIELYKKFQDLVLADRPAIFLYIPTYTYATSDKVHGFDVTRISNPADRFVGITSWYMETKGEWNF